VGSIFVNVWRYVPFFSSFNGPRARHSRRTEKGGFFEVKFNQSGDYKSRIGFLLAGL